MESYVVDIPTISLLDRQRGIQSRCYHPLGGFEIFGRDEIEQSISARFEKQVAKYPDRLAIKTDDRELTYSQLNRISNHIARAIQAGYGQEDAPVVLLIEHGLTMVCGIMGVLKAGKTYVTLDPLYPHDRNSHIMADSQAGLMVTNAKNLDYAKELTQMQIPIINIDELDTDAPASNLDLPVSLDQIAYILYTSGSTGKPKGVYQNHRNLLHEIMQYTNTLHICHNDRMTLLYSFNVNGSLRGTFGAILNGAALFTYDIKAKGLNDLADWLRREEITFFHSVPTVFRHFMDTLKSDERFPSVRLVRFGGERVPASNVDFYKKHFPPHCILYTGMGLTEASTIRQYFTDKDTELTESVVPTGFAVDEREIILLDDEGQVVGFGEVGQIAVKSRYLALGYWRNPELTSKVFLPAPDEKEARIYLTGDLGRLLPDGQLIHMGRKDAQVKVRGFRVETAEVEAALLEHPQVKEAAVVAWPDANGDNYLAAYIVARGQNPPTTGELYRFLREKLPDYMVPAAFVSLESMPLTPNSKVNRRALPEPEKVRSNLGTKYVAPRAELELELTRVWEKVLNLKPIGIQDNFFEIGGNSLLAVQLFAQIHRVTGQDIPLATLLQAPTIEKMTGLIRNKGWKPAWSSLVPIQPAGTRPPLFCVHAVGGNVLSLRDLGRYLGKDQPFYALQSKGLDGKEVPLSKVEEMASYYIEEIQTIQSEGPYYLAGQSSGGIVAFEMAQQLLAKGYTVGLLALIDTYEPYNMKSVRITRDDRLDFHWKNLKSEGLSYLLYQTNERWKRNIGTLETRVAKQVKAVAHKFGRPIPYRFRHVIVRDMVRKATRSYNPRTYLGCIVLFRAVNSIRSFVEDRHGVRRGWNKLAAGGLEICDIDGAHNLEQEPYVGTLAKHLNRYLAEIQSK